MEGEIRKTSDYQPPVQHDIVPQNALSTPETIPDAPKQRHWEVTTREKASESTQLVDQTYLETQKPVFPTETKPGLFNHTVGVGGFPSIPFTRDFFERWLNRLKDAKKEIEHQTDEERKLAKKRHQQLMDDLQNKYRERFRDQYDNVVSRQEQERKKDS